MISLSDHAVYFLHVFFLITKNENWKKYQEQEQKQFKKNNTKQKQNKTKQKQNKTHFLTL
jgi:hypothetical protein